MNVTLTLDGKTVRADLGAGVSLGIPIGEDGRHPRFFVDQGARFSPLQAGDFTGRVCHGGSCNADVVEFIPHCHGTHTEGHGHVTSTRDPVDHSVNEALYTARLVSVSPDRVDAHGSPILSSRDLTDHLDRQALIIRTLPNEGSKRWRDYSHAPCYPILSDRAMQAVAAAGVQHLLIDTPSIDAADDPSLRLHRLFWQMAPGQLEAPVARRNATLTEMIFVPDALADGDYLIHLGLSTLVSDATPSCPTLFELS
jgi:kynurenine formamidase